METKQYGTLKGLKVNVNVYATVAEGDLAAGKEGAMLDQANDNLAYRGPLAEGREILCDLIEESTGIERKTQDTGKKDKDGNPILKYTESEGAYAERVCIEKGWEDLSSFQPDFDAACALANDGAGLAVDAKARERKPSTPKKLGKKYLDTAAVVLAAGNSEKALTMVRTLVPGATFTATADMSKTHAFKGEVRGKQVDVTQSLVDCEKLGGLLKAYDDAKRKQEEDNRMADLGE